MKDLNLDINRIMTILLRALDQIDVRLVDHGHRVAYILYKMMQTDGTFNKRDMLDICIVASLHDIGAYKTEEIDHMMRFESEDVFDHSIYGYLFLKHMSPLSKWAEIVLYHHLNYEMHHHYHYEHLKISDMIHLADRMDVTLQLKERWLSHEELSAQADRRFAQASIDLFHEANELYDIKGKIMDGSYLNELFELGDTVEFNDEFLLGFIKMIAYSIDFRSETTVSHVVTTVSISQELGKLARLDETELKKIQLGAYLHDIGKIATPLEILEKPGRLTDEELHIMRKHTEITRDILENRIHDDVCRIASRHHEKIDGSGYPMQLTGDQLTLSERIVSVADVMSALAGRRSYKESYSKEVAVDLLTQMRHEGKLCSHVIDMAVRNYDIIMESSKDKIIMIKEMYNCIRDEFHGIKKRFEEMG